MSAHNESAAIPGGSTRRHHLVDVTLADLATAPMSDDRRNEFLRAAFALAGKSIVVTGAENPGTGKLTFTLEVNL